MENERVLMLRLKTQKLTTEPGCYLMKNKGGTIIYIGKAKNLRKRVISYFAKAANHLPKVEKMVQSVYDYDYIVTSSEFEALVLECSLIKHYQPKYNILLKDDKGYHYIKIINGPYRRITAEMQKIEDGATYLGPYTSRFVVRESVEEVNKAFGLPTCRRVFPRDIGKERACLLYYIKQCSGVCRGKITQKEYDETVEAAIRFLKNENGEILNTLEQEMFVASEALDFERAAKLRDRISAIKRLREKQQVAFTSAPDQDVVGVVRGRTTACAVILKIRDGKLVDKLDFPLGELSDIESGREEFIHLYYYENRMDIPKQVVIDGGVPNAELTEAHLSHIAGHKVTLHMPKRGEQMRLVEMAVANAAELISFDTEIYGKDLVALDELGELLGMESPPLYIESYDISNIGDDYMVGGMVVFENGVPNKKKYKRFTIKTVETQDDYAAMSEVIHRRFSRYKREKSSEDGFGKLPDLILLDGGKGHLSVISEVLKELSLPKIPIYGMVKDTRHKTRALVGRQGEIALKPTKSAYRLVYQIQEEVHRYAISYGRISHKKATFQSVLTEIPGIGTVRAKNMMKHFKTIEAISKANKEEILNVRGMSDSAADSVVKYFGG